MDPGTCLYNFVASLVEEQKTLLYVASIFTSIHILIFITICFKVARAYNDIIKENEKIRVSKLV